MKKSVIFCTVVLSLFSIRVQAQQTQTITVVKNQTNPNPNSAFLPGDLSPHFYAGYAYSCKRIQDLGSCAGLSFSLPMNFILNPELCAMEERYELSGFDAFSAVRGEYIKQSATHLLYFKLLFGYYVPLGTKSNFTFGIAPEKLLSVNNENKRLSNGNFYDMNLAYFASIGRRFNTDGGRRKKRDPFYMGLRFMGDINPNLKDEGIYDHSGNLLHNQKSKNYVLEFEFTWLFRHW